MKVFVISDLHFFHKNIIKLTGRPYQDLEDMHINLIENWNKVVGKEDTIYILGDFAFGAFEKAESILTQLNGKKHLVIGNHDKFIDNKNFNKKLFASISNYCELNYNGEYYILSHYPFRDWNHMYRGSIHLHGHTHQKNIKTDKNCFCVCVEAHNYAPVDLDFFKDLKS